MDWLLQQSPMQVQSRGQQLARGRTGYCFFMEQGLGKTALAMNDYLLSKKHGVVDTLVVIAPNFLKQNWAEEARKFGFPEEIDVYPNVTKYTKNVAVHVEGVIHSTGDWLEKHFKGKKVYLVIDESSTIKNHNSSRTKRCLWFANNSEMVRCLSGTYAPEGPHEVWPQLKAIRANVDRYKKFEWEFCEKGGFKGNQVIGIRDGAEAKYRELLERNAFIATKDEWLDLPEKTYNILNYDMSPDQLKAYKEMVKDNLSIVEDEKCTAKQLVTVMLRLQTIGSGFIKSEEGKIVDFKTNPKLDVLFQHLKTHRRKTVVMYVYRHSGILLRSGAERAGLRWGSLHGGMGSEAIKEVTRFNEEDVDVMFCQIQVARYGWTLLGNKKDRCREMVFYENSFSTESRLQAEDRIHRIGQDTGCGYFDLVGAQQDRTIIQSLIKKRDMFESIRDSIIEMSKLAA